MKRILIACNALLLFFSSTVFAQPENYTIDPAHSYILWHINHLGYSTQTGKWFATGNIVFDSKQPQNSKVTANINTANVVTGIPDLDKHIVAEDFLDVANYPTATFVSDKITVTGKNTAKITGNLTLHGVTKPVTLIAKLNKNEMNTFSDKQTLGISATTAIKRSDFGISKYLPNLGDDIKINVEIEATKAD